MFPRNLTDADLALLARRAERELLAVPDWVTRRALAIAEPAAPAQPAGLASGLRRWVASLRFDSWQVQPAPALRTRGAAPRQLLYSVGEHDFDLRVHGEPDKPGLVQLAGQVLGPTAQGRVQWRPAEGSGLPASVAGQAELDDMGEFRTTDLPAGGYILTVQVAGGEVELPPLDLRPTRPA